MTTTRIPRIAAYVVTGLMTAGVALAAPGRPIAGSIGPDRLKSPSGPSSVKGLAEEPSVAASSADVRYAVPIELPGGYGGLAPSIALTYSGALGNGPIGIGWTLTLPQIQRTLRLGRPTFDDSIDELEISGIASGRLVPIAGGEYRVEGMGQTVRVRAIDGGFEVDDGNGVRYRIGTSAPARLGDATHTQAWLVERQTNLMGEQIEYTYVRDSNQLYPSGITWGPRGIYRAQFTYESRSDVTTSYRTGFKVETSRRLSSIAISVDGVERRAYQLSYAPDDTFPVARLTGVASTGVNGDLSWPALAFTYAAPTAPAIEQVSGTGNWRLNNNGATLVDLDGDGAVELLQIAAGGHSFRVNQNGTFGAPKALPGNALPISSVQLQDVDGDARAELLVDTGTAWSVYKFAKSASGTVSWVKQPGDWPGSAPLRLRQPATTRFADLNGDGIVDGIRWNNEGLLVHLATRTGFSTSTPVGKIGGTALPSPQGRFQDINGDGLDDYIVVAVDHLDEFLGKGDGTFEPARRIDYPFAENVGDPQDIELADLDRDGLLDLVKLDTSAVRWFRGRASTGTSAFRPSALSLANPEPLATSVVIAVADTNGNGSEDVVWSSGGGIWRMDMAGPTTAGMLKTVSNGLGLVVTFDYQSAHALSVAATPPWSSNVPIAMPVPVKKTTELGPGEHTRYVTYGVRDGVWDSAERRFAGFLTASVTTAGETAAETSTVTTRYLEGTGLARVLRGQPETVEIADGSGTRVSFTTNTWTTMAIGGLPDVPLLRRAIRTKTTVCFDPNGCAPTNPSPLMTEQTFEYDDLGRAKRIVDKGRLDIPNEDESVTETTYADDDTTWVRDRVCEHKISSLTNLVATHERSYFGDETTQHALCVVGKGWQRETRAWLDREARWVTRSQTSYDLHGNPTSVVQAGVERRFEYDTDGLFLRFERLGALAWQATWDPVLGAITAVSDPNGHTTHTTYDALGRVTGTAIDGRPPHRVIEYDWSAPFPKTTLWQFDGALADVAAKPATWSANGHWRQTVDVANGAGGLRYHAQRVGDAQWIVSSYHEVDANGRVVFAGRPVYSSQLETSARPAGIAGDTLLYDPLGRLVEQDLPTGARRTYSYFAFERTMQEADLAPVHSTIDGQGRALLTERKLSDGTHEVVQASYDAAGRLIQMTLAGGAITRTFSYDTLGRLVQSHDPDLGDRILTWDDGDRLLSETNAVGQAVHYSYDELGRLAMREGGAVFQYHYDEARPGAGGELTNLAGKLSWVEEPTGGLDVGYDELSRVAFSRRRIDAQVSELTTRHAASGLVLGRSYDDGFSLAYQYDPAGRFTQAGDLWSVLDQDAGGRPLHERAGNGVDTQVVRDDLGLPSEVDIRDGDDATIYHVSATRNGWGSINSVLDLDGVGLDHAATFAYDGFARLTAASLGTGALSFTFGYAYDALHNMTSRTAIGPTAAGMFRGTYRYGEAGGAPRQLTSIADAAGNVTHTFGYDGAGRQIAQDLQTMTYNARDRLLRVDGTPGGSVTHVYGNDDARVKTTAPDGSVSYFFGDGTAVRNGVREHDVDISGRIVARVVLPDAERDDRAALGAPLSLAAGGSGVVLLAIAFALSGCWTRRRVRAAAAAGLVFAASCSPPGAVAYRSALSTAAVTFSHSGFAAGPTLFTDHDGRVVEERRYDPFGVAIDASIHTAGTEVVGPPDFIARDLNALNKRTDDATGWSDHGARWMAPEIGRWLTPDPPVAGPDAKFMAQPWGLNPYQYALQNPVAYWDPDGRQPQLVADDDLHTHTNLTIVEKDEFGNSHPGFAKTVLGYIDQLEAHPKGRALLRSVITGDQVITIRPSMVPTAGGAYTRADGQYTPNIGNNVTITLDPYVTDKDLKVYDNRKKLIAEPIFILLGHELIHALHLSQGKLNIGTARDPAYSSDFAPKEEEVTISTGHPSENELRKENRLPLRHGDGGEDTRPEAIP